MASRARASEWMDIVQFCGVAHVEDAKFLVMIHDAQIASGAVAPLQDLVGSDPHAGPVAQCPLHGVDISFALLQRALSEEFAQLWGHGRYVGRRRIQASASKRAVTRIVRPTRVDSGRAATVSASPLAQATLGSLRVGVRIPVGVQPADWLLRDVDGGTKLWYKDRSGPVHKSLFSLDFGVSGDNPSLSATHP